jgi:glycyl-tRNA synthetase
MTTGGRTRAPFGVYVHVPFCRSRCDYCAFATYTDRDHLMEAYTRACVEELTAAVAGEDLPEATSVFFGGGTPSRLPPDLLAAILDAVPRADGAEVTVECNPEDAGPDRLDRYRRAGVTRISLGVQSTVPHVLDGLGRRHTAGAVTAAARSVAAAGFASWNLDLIIGGAGETDADWERSLADLLALENPPPHVSAYSLTVEPGTPLADDPARHPDDDVQARRYETADAVLTAAGYRWEEISNWARPGHECRHNRLYWDQGEYRGIGSAAHSHRNGRRWWNVRTPDRYVRELAAGRSPVGGEEVLTDDQRRFEALALRIRTREGVPTGALPDDPDLEGLVDRRGGRAVLTVRGRLLANAVTVRLDAGAASLGGRPAPGGPVRSLPMPEPESTTDAPPTGDLMEKVVGLCKRRGFIFQSAEIYGGFRSTYDYGPLGVNLLRNVKNAWWEAMVQRRSDVVGLDAAILSPPSVWQASGHLANFTDPLVDCRNCHQRWRQDKIDGVCPNCGSTEFTEARAFNLMFKTHAGPLEDEGAVAYLRPETAQGMFINFVNVLQTTRKKPPFGIAQVGKSFRNEITPQNFVFRTREFEQMEMEFFVPPAEAQTWFEYWLEERFQWYLGLGIPADKLRLRHHDPDELSHYSAGTADVEFLFPWGWDELEGIANRTDFDLKAHAAASGEKLDYFDPVTNERYTPYVIEPAAGATRTMMAFLLAAYDEDEVGGEPRTVLRIHPRLAPYQVAVLPLSKKESLEPLSQRVLSLLQPHFMVDYDVTQGIGKRYRRQDEVGTPWCVTIDFDSLEDDAVTVRERDSTDQVRVPVDGLLAELRSRMDGA